MSIEQENEWMRRRRMRSPFLFDGEGEPDAGLGYNGAYYLQHDGKIWKRIAGNFVVVMDLSDAIGRAIAARTTASKPTDDELIAMITPLIPEPVPGPKGDAGAPGPKGDTGERGAKGDKGDVGTPGQTGPKGDKGDAGMPGVKGDAGNTGPKGDTGSQGPQGLQGVQGVAGTPADVTRVSSFGQTSVPVLALGGQSDVSVTFVKAMPNTAYTAQVFAANLTGINLSTITITEKSRSASGIVYTVRNTGLTLGTTAFPLVVMVQGS